MVKLCHFHHTQLHMGNYSIDVKPPSEGKKYKQKLVFKTTVGKVMEQNPGFPPFDPKGFFEQQYPDIDCDTCKSNWYGDSMDYSLAIGSLFYNTYGHY